MREGKETFFEKYKITDHVIHPDYDANDLLGFDIAVCKVEKLPGSNDTEDNYSFKEAIGDSFSGHIDPEDLLIGAKLEIAGYSADVEVMKGYMYRDEGTVVEAFRKTRTGGYVIKHTVQTSGGKFRLCYQHR